MKRFLSGFLALLLLLGALAGCGPTGSEPTPTPDASANIPVTDPVSPPDASPPATPKPCNLTVTGADVPMTRFAQEEIMAAAQKAGVEDAWTVSFDGIDETLEEQAYAVTVGDKTISIKGGDENGLMYGGLEVAEELALYGVEGITSSTVSPTILNRGIKFNAPLDMRTPSYTDAGDAAQWNIESMWDMEFWKEQFDDMARARMNTFTLWNLNPFPSMVKVPEYPDVALDDVWRTTIPFDESYNGTATNMVREEHWQEGNYEIIKTMTIDEKIDFWREVMQYAADRGIDFYVITWNIYTYGEHGKYGITSDMNDQVTRDYYRCSVRELVKTYPLLAGLGFTAGENMEWVSGEEYKNEEWLWETYGLGINDALAEEPDREFTVYHRLHLAEFDTVKEIWKDFKGTVDFSEKYSFAHMHSSTHPTFADSTLAVMPEDDRLWLEVRCDDGYDFRWGDADFVREYIAGMPDESRVRGFLYGADGYVLGREYAVKDSDFQGRLHIDKHWYEYTLLGRLGYDVTLTTDRFRDIYAAHYDEISRADADKLFETVSVASKVIPQVNRQIWFDTDLWYPEMNFTEVRSFGYLDVKRYINNDQPMPDSGTMSFSAYADYLAGGESGSELQTPAESAANLRQWGEEVLKLVAELEANKPAELTYQQKDFYSVLKDQESTAYLALYYAEKFEGVIALRQFNDTQDESFKTTAVEHLKAALEHWKTFAALFDEQYIPQQCGRLFSKPDPDALTAEVEKDISTAEKWKQRKY